ncbi:MAG: paraquat-inducible membrane protein A [Gammaproteobacteria bacterium]|nr:paraquat-inducible membrane protein A [Gammaproteobacteria bacterium]
MSASTARALDLVSCHSCMKLTEQDLQVCPRCGSDLHPRKADSLNRTMALLITSCLLYIPANLLPIMVTEQFGRTSENTIISGVLVLIKNGSIPIAAIIFFASVVIPLGKLAILFYLCWTVKFGSKISSRQRTLTYRVTETVGKWSMIDVFVVAILAALVHLGGILSVHPGEAGLAFAGVVVLTMLAAKSFDPRLIWDRDVLTNE